MKLELIIKQWAVINFCAHLGKSLTETKDLIQLAYGTEAMMWSKVFKHCKEFCDGWIMIQHDEGSGHPKQSVMK